jgi:hypothetical protein
VYVCKGHLHNYQEHGSGEVEVWLPVAGPLRVQRTAPSSPTVVRSASATSAWRRSTAPTCWIAHEEITRLKAENRKLRDRLAVTLADAWQADLTDTPRITASNEY